MTRAVITAPPDMPLGELAILLERRGIKRVPIVDGEKLVGIVSRADLLDAVAAPLRKTDEDTSVADASLRERIASELSSHLLTYSSQINVVVQDGIVELWGDADSRDQKNAIRLAAELMPGVQGAGI